MKRLFAFPAALAVTLAIGSATAIAPAALSESPARGHARLVSLITGQRFIVDPATPGSPPGPGRYVPSPNACAQIIGTFAIGVNGKVFDIPVDAMAYLGHGLDPHLFSVSAVAGAEKGGRLPVRVAYRGTVPKLPGITITSAAGGQATGYLTSSSEEAFGAALARQFAADHTRASYGADGLFASGTSISLADGTPGADGLARHAGPTGQLSLAGGNPLAGRGGVHLLTFRGDDLFGHPASGAAVVLVSVDNSNFYEAFNTISNGTAAFQVPAGHYFAITGYADGAGFQPAGIRWVVDPQINVTRDMTMRVGERLASSEITMVTPRPAVPLETAFEIRRTAAAGLADDFTMAACVGSEWVNPTAIRPTVGRLDTFTSQVLVSPFTASTYSAYTYSLAYQDTSGLIRRQRYHIRASGLATVQMRVHSAATLLESLTQDGTYPIQRADLLTNSLNADDFGLGTIPFKTTEYLNVAPGLVWQTIVERANVVTGNFHALQQDTRIYRRGERITENWDSYPLHPVPDPAAPDASVESPAIASATIQSGVFSMHVTPFTDNLPGHLGEGFDFPVDAKVGGTYEIDQNGTKIAGGQARQGFFFPTWRARLRPGPSRLRFVLDASRTGTPYPLSTHSHTVWTWRSATRPGAMLPAGWSCTLGPPFGQFSRNCAAQPLLTLNYTVARENLHGSVPAGPQEVTVAVSHFQSSASTAKITRVRVEVSFNNGATWREASVRRTGASRFIANFGVPATARFVALNVTAADTNGSTIRETLTRAYSVAP